MDYREIEADRFAPPEYGPPLDLVGTAKTLQPRTDVVHVLRRRQIRVQSAAVHHRYRRALGGCVIAHAFPIVVPRLRVEIHAQKRQVVVFPIAIAVRQLRQTRVRKDPRVRDRLATLGAPEVSRRPEEKIAVVRRSR